MSEAATEALINAGTNRQGALVRCDAATQWELQDAGLIGPEYGLTRKGSIARERAVNEALDKAFG